ncbi:MAG: hypothetical protein PUB22_10530 [Clostridiales bacterium]|nr:hypothetical protein [Clostridiales bacterium]
MAIDEGICPTLTSATRLCYYKTSYILFSSFPSGRGTLFQEQRFSGTEVFRNKDFRNKDFRNKDFRNSVFNDNSFGRIVFGMTDSGNRQVLAGMAQWGPENWENERKHAIRMGIEGNPCEQELVHRRVLR